MRVIKFRAWDSISKVLHSWAAICKIPLIEFELDHYTLEQFTGLTDKNGVDIYEGDIVSVKNRNFKVLYHGASFTVFTIDDIYCTTLNVNNHKLYEVKGNIHLNKELLTNE